MPANAASRSRTSFHALRTVYLNATLNSLPRLHERRTIGAVVPLPSPSPPARWIGSLWKRVRYLPVFTSV
ncbi:hypothetical protein AB0L25_10510 [Spirillospora sp. NPDC052242]